MTHMLYTVRFQWRRANIPDHSNLVNEENASLAMIQQNLSLTLERWIETVGQSLPANNRLLKYLGPKPEC